MRLTDNATVDHRVPPVRRSLWIVCQTVSLSTWRQPWISALLPTAATNERLSRLFCHGGRRPAIHVFADASEKSRGWPGQARSSPAMTVEPERLADNFELPLHRRTQHHIGDVVVETPTAYEGDDTVSRLADIPQAGARITLHRLVDANVRCRPG